MNPAHNLFLIGPMGAGKTTVGRRLAARWNLRFIDLDQEIEARSGASIAWIFEKEGEAGFRSRERRALAELTQVRGTVLATGGGSILDPLNRQDLRERGFVVYLALDVDAQWARLQRDHKRPLLHTEDRMARLQDLHEQRTPLYLATADLVWPHRHQDMRHHVHQLSKHLESTWLRPQADGGAGLP